MSDVIPIHNVLLRPETETILKAIRFAQLLIVPADECCLRVADLDIVDAGGFCEAAINVCMAVADERMRQKLFELVMQFVSLFDEEGRFALLSRLIARCPYGPIAALLVTRVKSEVRVPFVVFAVGGSNSPYFYFRCSGTGQLQPALLHRRIPWQQLRAPRRRRVPVGLRRLQCWRLHACRCSRAM